jgi:hypothetical protein
VIEKWRTTDQGFMQVLNLKNVRPQPLLIKDKK